MKIKVVVPMATDRFNASVEAELRAYGGPTSEFSVESLPYGPFSIESEYDEALCVPGFLEVAHRAEQEGFDGVIVDCFADPGIKAARELLTIPVTGPGESSMLLATSLARSFTIITVLPNVVGLIQNLATSIGVGARLASVRVVDIPVLALTETDSLVDVIHAEMCKALGEDPAQAFVLGCTGFMGVAEKLQSRLADEGADVPVIEPFRAAVKLVETLIDMGLKQSKLTYMTPPDKERVHPRGAIA